MTMKNATEAAERLKVSQELPSATSSDFKSLEGFDTEKMDDYLKDFVKPTGNCWFCERSLVVDWGIAHGEAHCVTCGVGAKMYHRLENKEGKIEKLEMGLQYHPRNYSVEDPSE